MRWSDRELGTEESVAAGALPGLDRLTGLVRSVRSPEFAGITFHEVLARSALNQVPATSSVPFSWTINPYRGCSHGCVYCFARHTHSYLDFDTGDDFDRQIVVKVNLVDVLRRELSRPSWARAPVALGTNTDPYQRAEGRYRLMPGVINAFRESGTPFSILTKGTTLRRDLPLLTAAADDVRVSLGVSLALVDEELHERLEPGAPTPRARLELVRAISDAGLRVFVLIAPILPWLTDSDEQLEAVVARVAEAGASSASPLALHLRPGAREWFLAWLERSHPELVGAYRELYRGGSYVLRSYASDLTRRCAPLLTRYGLAGDQILRMNATPSPARASPAAPVADPTLF